ncbi:MAG: hypothetical protein P8Q93_12105 [Ascidiaceihabitans sp.]|nr:hypothetical protein [Ascidiaceihabitans sp.]
MSGLDFSSIEKSERSRLTLAAESSSLLARIGFIKQPEDEAEKAIAALCKISSALVAGIATLSKFSNAYCLSAIARQLVEIEYMMYAVNAEHRVVTEWLNSSKQDRQKLWSPRNLYSIEGSPFSKEEYQDHCELGGHPTPSGIQLTHFSARECDEVFCEALKHVHSILFYLHEWLATNNPVRGKVEVADWQKSNRVFKEFFQNDPAYQTLIERHANWESKGAPRP